MPLITFEGIDGSGKSTQIKLLQQWLNTKGIDATVLREPGGTELSEKIRSLLLDNDLDISPVAELLLFSAARAQLVDEKIKSSLNEGHWIILDRFFDSTTAYQGYGREVASIGEIQALNRLATSALTPICTFLLHVSVEEASKRFENRSQDRMESAGTVFFEKVSKAYLELAKENERIELIDGSQAVEDIHQQIKATLESKLGL